MERGHGGDKTMKAKTKAVGSPEEADPEQEPPRPAPPPPYSGWQKERHDVTGLNPWKLHARKRCSPGASSLDVELGWRVTNIATGRNRPLQRPSQAPQLLKGNLLATKGSPRCETLAGSVPIWFLALTL
jgi:hypothetical protein